jgi:hypothetical protein
MTPNTVRRRPENRPFPIAIAFLAALVAAAGDGNASAQSPDAAQRAARRDEAVAAGIEFLKRSQAADGSYSSQAGIGVTALVATALMRSGVPADQPPVAKSLKLLESFVRKDGGIYQPGSRLRNYETCLAVMCFKAAGHKRYETALDWASKHYSVDTNPGLGKAGLYYYLHLFSTAMDASGQQTLADANGKAHNWRADVVAQLASTQNKDGSWSNTDTKWLEGDANLVTGYALLTLAYCKPDEAIKKSD